MEAYLVCFDIGDDGLRRRIGDVLLRYGDRVQRSVFEVSVRNPAELNDLRAALRAIIEPDDDDIRLYRLCAHCRRASSTVTGERIAAFPAMLVV
jgi:CRISPR-associated protein Cas2